MHDRLGCAGWQKQMGVCRPAACGCCRSHRCSCQPASPPAHHSRPSALPSCAPFLQVSDAVLTAAFQRFPTFQKAKVVRYAATGKTKGYGFVSFGDMAEGAKVIKEMQGKYVGE